VGREVSSSSVLYGKGEDFRSAIGIAQLTSKFAVLSLFAARAGAKRVIAIECSSIIEQARQIMEANREFGDKVTLIQSKCEEIDALPDGLEEEGVDIIISEWMGYFLLYESMLDTVIYARDRWLKKGGRILPDKAVLYMGAIEDGDYKKEKIEFWDDVYGFDMSVSPSTICDLHGAMQRGLVVLAHNLAPYCRPSRNSRSWSPS
jgi:predicted RNA methylase